MVQRRKRSENRLVDTALPKRGGKYADGKGLWLVVSETGARSWLFRYKMNKRERFMGLGSYPAVALADARDRAGAARRDIAAGDDPIDARERRAADKKAEEALAIARRKLFKESAEDYIASNRADWRSARHAQQWESSLKNYVYPIIGDLPVGEIDTTLVLKVLEQDCGGKTFWTAKPETASRVRGRMQMVLAWAKARKHRSGDNPASWENLMDALPKMKRDKRVKHFPALPYSGMGAFMAELRKQEGVDALGFQFLILNTARTIEVVGARWPEIDRAAKIWTIPPERSKNAKEQRKPLSDAALAILEAVKDLDPVYIFPGEQEKTPLADIAFLDILAGMNYRKALTAHGFRSTFKDWAIEKTAFPESASELALGHNVGDEVERSYRRGDMLEKRFKLAAAWAAYCNRVEGSNVVPMDQPKRKASAE